ncbi:MBL fold metallo-hydrolase [uncultured Lacinutrix sp.]|uniref:MBL fold metallo-hydrolase n=1 Tax=uncultured Lacinutrix sp. TaxID=574032 RepID=UPI002636F5BA|nr:MBL fold metallo-hydrolase [uncultured Lacinutrix sp.]
MKLTIHGYSTALFATWYFVEELGILFDAGDGVVSNLLGKAGKIRNVFISHADRDHLMGLLQYNQLFAKTSLNIHYPKDANSFKHLNEFLIRFDPHMEQARWKPINDLETIAIKNSFSVQAFENKHINVPNQLKSVSYKVIETKHKLKPEFSSLNPKEIVALKKEKGDDYIKETSKQDVLIYSGDTPVYDYSKYDNCKTLIHEATFLTKNETVNKNNKNKHSSLEEVMEMVANISIETLVLGHFSSRYDINTIDKKIKALIKHYNIKIPVYRMPIGVMQKDILNGKPIN